MINSDLMSIQQAADLLGESRSTTVRRIEAGELAATRMEGRLGMYIIKRADVEKLRDELVAELERKVEAMKAGAQS